MVTDFNAITRFSCVLFQDNARSFQKSIPQKLLNLMSAVHNIVIRMADYSPPNLDTNHKSIWVSSPKYFFCMHYWQIGVDFYIRYAARWTLLDYYFLWNILDTSRVSEVMIMIMHTVGRFNTDGTGDENGPNQPFVFEIKQSTPWCLNRFVKQLWYHNIIHTTSECM